MHAQEKHIYAFVHLYLQKEKDEVDEALNSPSIAIK